MTGGTWTLVVLAAGMGRRFGGNKQLAPLGPAGELLSDYTLYDALEAGATRAVYVIRPDLENALCLHHRPWLTRADIRYAIQPLPRGTTDAVLAARDEITGALVVVNADDFYGRAAITAAAAWAGRDDGGIPAAAVIAYPLGETLSLRGGVSRAVLEMDADGWLESVTEQREIRTDSGLAHDLPISMNCWILPPAALLLLQEEAARFWSRTGDVRDRELALPDAMGNLVRQGRLRVKVLRQGSGWIGVTHAADLPQARAALQVLIDRGEYPSPLIRIQGES